MDLGYYEKYKYDLNGVFFKFNLLEYEDIRKLVPASKLLNKYTVKLMIYSYYTRKVGEDGS